MPRGVSKCPNCGEPVSPFAAGCAICGADLEAARAQAAARRRIEVPRVPSVGGSIDWVHVAIAVVLALAVPPVGLALALYWAVQRNRFGERTMTLLMLAAAALALAALLAPVWFWSHILGV
jgi:hypothetical protein